MKQNPLEQPKLEDINSIREEMRAKFEHAFDNREGLAARLEEFILSLDLYQQRGLAFDKEAIIKGLRESISIEDKEVFVTHLLGVLEPFIALRSTRPDVFEQVNREHLLNSEGNVRLSEVLYTSLGGERKELLIHLAPAKEFIKEKGLRAFKQDIKDGLMKLAEIVKSMPGVEEVYAISWIVAKNPNLLESLGFTIEGELSEEDRAEHFPGDDKPIGRAFMTREDFLARYGNGVPERM